MDVNNETSYLMHPADMGIIYGRSIFCFISMFCCLLLMLAYFILIFQIKFNLCNKKTRKEKEKENDEYNLSDSSNSYGKDDQKIGLGSHFMFILTVSNFFGALFESLFYFYYKNINDSCIDEESSTFAQCNELFIKINDSQFCKFLGLSHNFFDLYSVCWTSMLTLLFFLSTNLSNEMSFNTKKYLIFGFVYSTSLSFILMIIPCISGDNFGFSRFYCSYRYHNYIDINGNTDERNETKGWRFSFFIVLIFNLVFNLFCLIKTHRFYSDKLNTLKQQDKNEFKSLIIFVWVFRIFPIVIFLSRIYKTFATPLLNLVDKKGKEYNKTPIYIIEYINNFIFACNGIFLSIASLVFFRGIFVCCSSDKSNQRAQSLNIDIPNLDDDNND